MKLRNSLNEIPHTLAAKVKDTLGYFMGKPDRSFDTEHRPSRPPDAGLD